MCQGSEHQGMRQAKLLYLASPGGVSEGCPPDFPSPSYPTQAKEVLQAALPVHEEVQRMHVETISALVIRSKNKRAMDRTTVR